MENVNAKVTSINDLKKYQEGEIVKLPDFGPGQEFYAKLRRPSMLSMAKQGKIPNNLLESASNLFVNGNVNGNQFRKMDSDTLKKMFDIMDLICEASFIEPKYSELQKEGIELTDDQLMFIFNYSPMGVKSLENFSNPVKS